MVAAFACDVAVVGAGPAGLLAGLCCRATGLSVVVVGPRADERDGRTAALMMPSIELLKRLGIWPEVASASEPLTAIRLVDATNSVLRAPELMFRASEIGLEAFGQNVPNSALTGALGSAAAGNLNRIESAGVDTIQFSPAGARLTTREGQLIDAKLIAAADGRNSLCRTVAGIGTRSWTYDQWAVVTTFTHSRPHQGVSTEFHRNSGPLTLVPGPGQTSSLVWVERPDEASRLSQLNDQQFATELGTQLCGLLGQLSDFAPRRRYPISGQTATQLAANRVALIGEAGHVLPPIGAQGLNLSFRDAATLAEVAGKARRADRDVGGPEVLAEYETKRRPDIDTRFLGVNLLNRVLISTLPGAPLARGLGLFALSKLPWLRAELMRQGVGLAAELPELMRPCDDAAGPREAGLDVRLSQRA